MSLKTGDYKLLVEQFATGAIPNATDDEGRTILHELQRLAYPEDKLVDAARICVDNGVNVNQADIYGLTALHFAAGFSVYSGHLLLTRFLLLEAPSRMAILELGLDPFDHRASKLINGLVSSPCGPV